MASSSLYLLFIFLLLYVQQIVGGCFSSIFCFGDSISDTGNLLIATGDQCRASNLPYGETFFGRPTGRYSDGRLIVDFIAEAMGMPFLPPFLGGAYGGGFSGFRRGANFAVAGATAMSNDFFRTRGLDVTWTNISLGAQVGLFKELLSLLNITYSGREDILRRSLFLVGEIGGNDYNHAFFQRWSFSKIKSSVHYVIDAISMTIDNLINMGAKTLLVPGNFPIGCIAAYLTLFETSSTSEDYDKRGCLKWLNEFSEYHNTYLKQKLNKLRYIHPNATIIYADYFHATLNFIDSANNSTRLQRLPLVACCGCGSGRYNYDDNAKCGTKNSTICNDPSNYLSWDGMHFTEATYEAITKGLLEGPFADPSLNEVYSSSNNKVVIKGLTFHDSKVN